MRVGATIACALVVGLFGPSTARADCAGFTDVDVGGFLTGFCSNVTWIKNRAITVGCSSPTLYCPNEPVARLSMALFMNRLGNVLSPHVVDVEGAGGALDLNAGTYICQSPAIAPATYPRTTHIDAVLSFEADAPVSLVLVIASSNNGSPFQVISETGSNVDSPGGSRRNMSSSWISVAVPGQPGQQYAVRAFRAGGAGNVTNWTCSLQVMVMSGVQP